MDNLHSSSVFLSFLA